MIKKTWNTKLEKEVSSLVTAVCEVRLGIQKRNLVYNPNLDQTISEFLTHTISTIIGMDYIIFQLLPMLDRRASLVIQMVKNPPATWKTWVPSLDWKDPLEKGMATHSSVPFFKNFKNVYYPFFFFAF